MQVIRLFVALLLACNYLYHLHNQLFTSSADVNYTSLPAIHNNSGAASLAACTKRGGPASHATVAHRLTLVIHRRRAVKASGLVAVRELWEIPTTSLPRLIRLNDNAVVNNA